jgi:hypothetical protein
MSEPLLQKVDLLRIPAPDLLDTCKGALVTDDTGNVAGIEHP